MSAALRAIERGAEAYIFNAGLPVGGSCLHVGCVPSKYLIRAGEAAHQASHTRHPGISPRGVRIEAQQTLAAARDLVRNLREANYEKILQDTSNLHYYPNKARLVNPQTVESEGRYYEGDGILIATGSHTRIPNIPGLRETPYLTNETFFALKTLPTSMIVLGGGYIALELAQLLLRLGVEVTLLQRGEHVLRYLAPDIGDTLTQGLRKEGMALYTGQDFLGVSRKGHSITVATRQGEYTAQALLVATGRNGNTMGLHLEAVGVQTDSNGFIPTAPHYETNIPKIFAAGDVLGRHMFVYTASYEGEFATDNLLVGTCRTPDFNPMPWVVFTDPQVSGAGLDLEEARENGMDADAAQLPVARWPRFRVAEDSTGFLRLIRDRKTNTLLGARAVAHEAGDLMTEICLLIRKRVPIPEILALPYPYLTLSEGIQRCAMRFPPIDGPDSLSPR